MTQDREAMLNGIRRLDPFSERVCRDVREAERERYAWRRSVASNPRSWR